MMKRYLCYIFSLLTLTLLFKYFDVNYPSDGSPKLSHASVQYHKAVRKLSSSVVAPITLLVTDYNLIKEYMVNDNVCEILKISSNQNILDAVFAEIALDKKGKKLFTQANMLEEVAEKKENEMALFYNSLLHANLLKGVNFSDTDYLYALRILDFLEEKYPDNGAFPYFLAEIHHILGSPSELQKKYILKALKAKNYNTFVSDAVHALKSVVGGNATLWLFGSSYLSRIIIPKAPSLTFIQSFFPDLTKKEANLIIHFGMRLNDSIKSYPDERQVGQNIVRGVWKIMQMTEPLPQFKSLQQKDDFYYLEVAAPLLNEARYCDRRSLDNEFLKRRLFLQ